MGILTVMDLNLKKAHVTAATTLTAAIHVSCGGLVWTLLLALVVGSVNTAYANARSEYQSALDALDDDRWRDYEQLRSTLDQYPLAVYLDYQRLLQQPQRVQRPDAERFLAGSRDTPLANRFLDHYLTRAGREGRWRDFLAVMPREPNRLELKCYYLRARLATGDTLAAWEGAERLWVHGRSRPDECDPLFASWIGADKLSDDIVWARLLKAFDARQRSLMRYVARQGSTELQPYAELLAGVYSDPQRVTRLALPADDSRATALATHGLVYYARYHPQRALSAWLDLRDTYPFNTGQTQRIETAIALHTLFKRDSANLAWLQDALARLQDDKLVEIRLRWTLAEQDWSSFATTLPLLSPAAAQSATWRYWRAVWQHAGADPERGEAALRALAQERDYYGFLAADRLQLPYAFNNQPLVLESSQRDATLAMPAVRRVQELVYHDAPLDAASEWQLLVEAVDLEQRAALAGVASEQGWYRLSIEAAYKAGGTDWLAQRFPLPYRKTFQRFASLQQVAPSELLAIARRESSFFPAAVSPVGARGLMQVMPATGKQVARSLGEPHSRSDLYEVEHNVLLGSAYYRQLLDRFNGNRVMALAGYNAGPHRVDRWTAGPSTGLPVELWIETLPFRETRNYVKRVLEYNVVFEHLLGMQRPLLSSDERAARY